MLHSAVQDLCPVDSVLSAWIPVAVTLMRITVYVVSSLHWYIIGNQQHTSGLIVQLDSELNEALAQYDS